MNSKEYKNYLDLANQLIVNNDINNVSKNEQNGSYSARLFVNFELIETKVSKQTVQKDYCTCKKFRRQQVCQHTIALRKKTGLPYSWDEYEPLQEIEEEILVENYKKEGLQNFLDQMNNKFSRSLSELPLLPLSIFYQLDYHNDGVRSGFYLRLYIHNGKRNYLVKNINELLHVFHFPGTYIFTPKVSMVISPECFSKEDQEFIQWLTYFHLGHLKYHSYYEQGFQREVLIDAVSMDQLLARFPQQLLKIVIDGKGYKEINTQLNHKESFITCHIQQVASDEYELFFEDHLQVIDMYYQFVIVKDQYYRLDYPTVLKYDSYQDFSKQLYRFVAWRMDQLIYNLEGNFHFSKSEISDLLSKYLPIIQSFAKLDIDKSLSNDMISAQLQPIFHFSLIPTGIRLDVMFMYDDVVLARKELYRKKNEKLSSLIRDLAQEERVEQFILANHFLDEENEYRLLIKQDADFYHFFKYTLTQFNQFGEVILDTELQRMFANQEQYKPKLSIIKNGGFLDVAFKVDGIELEDVQRALIAISRNESFVRLEDGRFIDLTNEEFQDASEALSMIRQVSQQNQHQFQIPLYRGGQLAQLGKEQIEVNQDFTTFVEHLTHPQDYPVDKPTSLNATLRPYQFTGFRWLKMLSDYQLGGILADEMGLGKTLQTITYLLAEKQADNQMQALIIVPASLVYNWYQECKQYAPELKVQVVNGGKEKREEQLATKADVYVTSYQSFRQDEKIHEKMTYQILILDEAQMVKNSQTKTAQALRKLSIPKRFALSGTPVENKIEELWSIFQIIIPGFFPSKVKFKKFSTEMIAQMIQPFVLRRTKEEVLLDLPERIETNYFNELSKEQKEIYLAQLEQIQATLAQMNSEEFKKQRISILAGLTRLRQICCSPQLYLDDFVGESGKLEQLKELVIQALENNRRMLIFSQFASMLNIIEAELDKLNIACFKLDGSIPSKQRMEMVEAFNRGEKPIFLISLKAGGTGLNLTGANTVILYDLWWNPAVEDQATSRAHRMGQKEVVEVWRLITEGTIEEKIFELQQSKRELFDQVIQGDESSLSQLTEEDIRQIFQVGME